MQSLASEGVAKNEQATAIVAPAPAAADAGSLKFITRSIGAILVVFAIALCYLAQEVLVPLVVAMLFSLLLSPVATLLQRLRLPRALASALVLLALVGIFAAAVASLAQPTRDWIAAAPTTMRTIEHRFDGFREPFREAQEATKKIEDLTQPSAPRTVVAQPSLLATMATSTPRALGSIAVVLLLIYFFLSSGDNFLRRVVEVAPRLTEKKMVVSIARHVQGEISRYLVTVSAINLGLGVAVAIAMQIIGLPQPLMWGAIAAILNFAPYVGPAATGFALLIAGFTTFDSLGHAFLPPGIFFALAFFEGQLITPTVIGKRLSLDPTIVFVWLLLWGWLWGIVGLLVAGPLLACFRIACQHVESLHAVSVLIGSGEPSDAPAKS